MEQTAPGGKTGESLLHPPLALPLHDEVPCSPMHGRCRNMSAKSPDVRGRTSANLSVRHGRHKLAALGSPHGTIHNKHPAKHIHT